MRKTLICLLLTVCAFAYAEEKTFMVMSDMHVMVKELWDQKKPGVFYSDPKMVEHSHELFDLAIQRVKDNAPDFLLVPGDLTYNGEKKNHEYVAQKFAELEKAGIQVFVIPGNHDISDPGAKDYSSGTGVKTANLSATDFAKLYADFGYKGAKKRLDKGVDSLAYMAYLFDDIAIIGLNTNQSNIGGHKSAGGFTKGMMDFLRECTDQALKDGRENILVMAHHPIMEHINGQSFIDKNHIANMTEGMIPLADIQEQLTAAHVHVVFTGHAHLHTASHIHTANGDLYDISTGSTSSYASPLRKGTLDTEKGMIKLVGDEITKYQEEGYLRDTVLANSAINTLASTLYSHVDEIKALFDKYPKLKTIYHMDPSVFDKYDAAGIRKVAHQYLDESMRKAMCALSRGDEDIFSEGNEAGEGIDAFNALLVDVIGVDYGTIELILDLYPELNEKLDVGVNPETLFRSIYENIVFIGDEEIYTPDAAGNLEIEDNEGSWLEDVSLRDPKSNYTLTLKGEHGKVTGAGTYEAGKTVTIEAIADAHYHFVEWSDGNKNAKREVTVNSDATYTAVFEIDQFTITVKAEHGTVTGAGKYGYNSTVTLEAKADEHYHFVKWSDGNTNAKREITVTKDETYTAEFAIDQYTVTVKAEHGKVTGAGKYDYNKKVTLEAKADEHYHFVKWSDGNTNAKREITVTKDETYTAEFAIDQYTITVKAEHGTVTGAGKYDYNAKVTLEAKADEHYHFVKWSDGNKNAKREITVTKDETYTAEFAMDQFTITVKAEHGKVTGAGKYDYNKKVTLEAKADEHYHFVKWSDGNTNAKREITVTKDETYTAEFAIDQFTITVKAEHGKVTGAGKYDYGTKVELQATADDGYEFKQWSDGNTDNPRKIEVTKDATYTAEFGKKVETAAETVEQAPVQAVKRMEHGKLVIYINGKRFNAEGKEL